MQTVANGVAQYNWFSSLDIKSAYHQVLILPEERLFTAFEANGQLYQFARIPFGLKNAVPCFQRVVNEIISKYNCKGTYACLDDITVCGRTGAEHDENLKCFPNAAKRCNITFNEKKCTYATDSIKLLGYKILNGMLQPDPDRVKPLLELPVPNTGKELQRHVGMFAYYSQWVPCFSEKIKPFIARKEFPLREEALQDVKTLKQDLTSAAIKVIDEKLPFVLKTDASDNAISATLNQEGRPVAFFSRTLNKCELHQSSVEKEACAIVEAIRKWAHLLSGCRLTVVTDQQSVSFMYDVRHPSRIKNERIMRWRMQLKEFDFEVVFRSGKLNSVPDVLSRAFCASLHESTLYTIHASLCHPGIMRLYHFACAKN